MRFSWQRMRSVARKEMLHILRDPTTLFFTFLIPIVEMFMLGYAIDTNVRHVRTVLFDQARTQESRQLVQQFLNTEDFRIVGMVSTDEQMYTAIRAGRARVAIKIPENYSRRIQAGDKAEVLVLVDGSESSVTGEIVGVSNVLAMVQRRDKSVADPPQPVVEARPRVLFNEDTRSANFFLPGMLVVLCQMAAVLLTSTSLVKEKEHGTIEQLFMTPVTARELVLGKIAPYILCSTLQFCLLAFFMWSMFRVPIAGRFVTLLVIFQFFLLTMMGLGLAISMKAPTRDAAEQMAIGTVIPSIFLSGYVFPLDSMPIVFYHIAFLIPTTWMIDAARGVILRGAGWVDLWPNAAVLALLAAVVFTAATLRFKKRL